MQRALNAKKESEAMEIDAPEDYTNLKEIDEINDGEIFINAIRTTSFSKDLLKDNMLKVKAKFAAKIFYLSQQ